MGGLVKGPLMDGRIMETFDQQGGPVVFFIKNRKKLTDFQWLSGGANVAGGVSRETLENKGSWRS